VETEAGKVSANSRIASIIQGASCNSSAAHLHFIVSQNGIAQNPFSHLSSVESENCSGSSCGSGDGDQFNPSGSWSWPISPKITMNQGYGSTWAVRNTWVGGIYNFHNGIDINGSSSEVRAVRDGTLYQGSYKGKNGCNLRYVRVDHSDSDLDTFYLHINY
jgi:murein DD-endopeptidase MepM/ murein hydrolase activator NlpD